MSSSKIGTDHGPLVVRAVHIANGQKCVSIFLHMNAGAFHFSMFCGLRHSCEHMYFKLVEFGISCVSIPPFPPMSHRYCHQLITHLPYLILCLWPTANNTSFRSSTPFLAQSCNMYLFNASYHFCHEAHVDIILLGLHVTELWAPFFKINHWAVKPEVEIIGGCISHGHECMKIKKKREFDYSEIRFALRPAPTMLFF